MSEPDQRHARVGVRELRQNLSVYLDRVKEGETFEVTEHGRAVARLGPQHKPLETQLERMIASGEATPGAGDILDLPPPIQLPPGTPSLSDLIIAMREEERY